MIDDLMAKFRIEYKPEKADGYHIKQSQEVYLFPDRQANLIVNGREAGVNLLFFKTLSRFLELCILKF